MQIYTDNDREIENLREIHDALTIVRRRHCKELAHAWNYESWVEIK